MITLENFKTIMKSVGAEPIYDLHGFTRSFIFNKFDNKIILTWYNNNCSATIGNGIYLCSFDNITINGNWPNHYKNNINLRYNNENILVIPLEK
jgi:hypothetical protein